MRTRFFVTAAFVLLAPAAALAAAASTASTSSGTIAPLATSAFVGAAGATDWRDRDDPKCGRGHAWGCKRGREDRYDDRRDRDRDDRDGYDRDRDRDRYDRDRYDRDRRYSRYDGYPRACVRAGGRVLGSAVLLICAP